MIDSSGAHDGVPQQYGRPVFVDIPPRPPSDGLPPVESTLLYNFIAVPPEQVMFLDSACRGGHVVLTAAAGVGKTSLLERFISIRNAATPDVKIYVVTMDRHSRLSEIAKVWPAEECGALVTSTEGDGGSPTSRILIVDEFVCLSQDLLRQLHRFGQIIICGDPAQGGYGVIHHVVRCLVVQLRATHMSLTTVWRSANRKQFALSNALLYGGRFEAIGRPDPDTDAVRTVIGKPTLTASAYIVAARVARHLSVNSMLEIVVVSSSRHAISMVLLHLSTLRPNESGVKRFRIIHPALLHGIEADIVIVAPSLVPDLTCQREIEKFAVVLAGRTRTRLEICYEFQPDGSPAALSLFLSQLFGWQFDTIVEEGVVSPLASFAASARAKGVEVREGLRHFTLLDRDDHRPITAVNPIAGSLRETLHRAAAMKLAGWKVDDCILPFLTPPLYKNGDKAEREVLKPAEAYIASKTSREEG